MRRERLAVFGIGMQELLIILAVALIVLGPKKLPEMARALGRAFAELQRAAEGLRSSVDLDVAMEEPEEEPVANDLPPPPGSIDEVAEPSAPDEAEEPSAERTA